MGGRFLVVDGTHPSLSAEHGLACPLPGRGVFEPGTDNLTNTQYEEEFVHHLMNLGEWKPESPICYAPDYADRFVSEQVFKSS